MSAAIRHIPLDRLVPHPDSPNRMSRTNLEKLVRNIERSGRYEPLVVRPCPGKKGFFQIINGRHRCEALRRLGRGTAETVVWNVDDEQTDVLVATLNRLSGRDALEQKVALLRRLRTRIPIRKLARLLPQTLGQIERVTAAGPLPPKSSSRRATEFAIPMVFFVTDGQQQEIEKALAAVAGESDGQTRAARRAAALARMAARFRGRPGDPAESGDR